MGSLQINNESGYFVYLRLEVPLIIKKVKRRMAINQIIILAVGTLFIGFAVGLSIFPWINRLNK
jgi:hypothetical protein